MSSLLYSLIKTSYVQPNPTQESIKDEMYGPFKGEVKDVRRNTQVASPKLLKEQYEKDEKAHELRKQKVKEYRNKYIKDYPIIYDSDGGHYMMHPYDEDRRGKPFTPGTIDTLTVPNDKRLREFKERLQKLHRMEDILHQSETKRDWSKYLMETNGFPSKQPTTLYERNNNTGWYDKDENAKKEKLILIDDKHNTNKLNGIEYNQKPFLRRFMDWMNPYYYF